MRKTMTPETMAARLRSLHDERNKAMNAYFGCGVALQAVHAATVAQTYRAEVALWRHDVDVAAGLSEALQDILFAATAAVRLDADAMSRTWAVRASEAEARATEITEKTAQAFNSGMTYVPGRGVVRQRAAELACDTDPAEVPGWTPEDAEQQAAEARVRAEGV